MPAERGYEQQLGPPRAVPLPQAGAGAFGAGVGAAIAELGAAGHAQDLRRYQLDRQQKADSEAADFNARFAVARTDADHFVTDLRHNPKPGGEGHAVAVTDWWRARADGLADGIADDRVRRSALAQLGEFGQRLSSNEYQWQEGQRVGKLTTDQLQATQASANRARRLPDPDAFAQELSLGRQGIEALAGVPPEVREKLGRDFDEKVSTGYLQGLIERDPAAVPRVLDSGAFDSILPPEVAEHLRRGAEVQLRRGEAEARARQAQELALVRQQLRAREVDLAAGAGSGDDRRAVAAQWHALGDDAKAEEWRGRAVAFDAVQHTRDWTLPQLDQRVAELSAKQARGALDGDEAHELRGLTEQRRATAERLAEPGGALLQQQYASGQPVAPLDPRDPASLRARADQAVAAAARYGRAAPEPLLRTELPGFHDLVHGGPAQRLEALAALQGFGDPRVIRAAATQAAGSEDGAFRVAAQLPLSVAREVLRGEETLRSAPKVFDEARARVDFAKWYGPVLAPLGGYRDDVFRAAKSFYAQRAVDGGLHQYDPGRFAEAVETVLGRQPGANGATGGVAHTPGGLVLVPQGMSGDELMRRFARASAADYARASGGRSARWSDGHVMTRGEFATMLPTAVGDGRYAFRSGGRMVKDEHGDDYTVDVRQLGQ
ncbi:hypothetical protein [Sphingomonas sp. BK235]|uniref:hypothetical protein n=1 Tax=Sphingomonas sp. BK235 TaxID=2512131 RepID=UPI0010F14202|nr:hypothetical protein [Sphingomonas sp. BK235]TCP35916.1 hypothetical protein EV292_102506 [Sphingomonas sp. BK235]